MWVSSLSECNYTGWKKFAGVSVSSLMRYEENDQITCYCKYSLDSNFKLEFGFLDKTLINAKEFLKKLILLSECLFQ